jgi:integrase/recombinase XerD
VSAPKVDTKLPTTLTTAEIAKILNVCDTREKAIISFLIDTMLRASEFVALTVDQIDFSTGKVLVSQTKSKKFRFVFVGIKARKLLLKYLSTREGITGQSPLFVSETQDEPLTYSGLAQLIRRISKRAGIPFTAHELRRTGVTLLHWNNNIDIYTLKELLGHSTLDMLKHYLRVDEAGLTEQSSKFSTIDLL